MNQNYSDILSKTNYPKSKFWRTDFIGACHNLLFTTFWQTVRPDWAIFEKSWEQQFFKKSTPMIMATFWQLLKKIALLLITTSGHSEWQMTHKQNVKNTK